MYASAGFSITFLGLASLTSSVLAIPGYRRQDDAGLSPWITINPSGVASTVTPVVTTINGAAATINAAPKSHNSQGSSTTGAGAQPTQAAGSSFNVCHNANGPFSPFCAPANGTHLDPGSRYYVTWDATTFPGNATVFVVGNYLNASVGGEQAFQSGALASSVGWYALSVEDVWRQGSKENYIDLFLATTGGKRFPGPRVAIGTAPVVEEFKPAQLPRGPALYIALPAVFGFIIVCVCGGFWWNRRARIIGLGNVMGRRRGYGIGKSRGERMGMGRKGAIKLQERDGDSDAGGIQPSFRDDTFDLELDRSRRRDSDLGSLVSTPIRSEFGNSNGGGNVFRSEMERQERERQV